MKSLGEAVQKFKSLKQKLKNISEQPYKRQKNYAVPKFVKADKQNLLNFQNTQHIEPKYKHPDVSQNPSKRSKTNKVPFENTLNLKNTKAIVDTQTQQQDHKNQTQKKVNHRKNKSQSFIMTQNAGKQARKQFVSISRRQKSKDSACEKFSIKLGSLNNSRYSQQYSRQLKSKQKTLNQINQLLEKKKQVLQTLERKIGISCFQQSKFSQNLTKGKCTIRAPNLFQMQNQGRKRSKSKPLTIRWK